MSRMDDDFFTYEVEIAVVTNIQYDLKRKTIQNNKCHMNLMIWNMIHLMSNLLNDVPIVYEKAWTDDGAWKEPALVDHYCEHFNYKNGCSEWPTYSWRDNGYWNGGNLPRAYIVGNALCYQDFEWYEALKD
ncbi:hypothetical protein Tco_1183407 [Tanacetum coccineum]